ncbi:YihY/virulence factor BrkB family protein [Bacillus sp. FJAT-42376]|uniref:YihY/virulence factor BrkB family protein n=1 Tax=Bacillus sp. FJAT-42376 TaxID=2014076 RepID=UPI000F4F475D|nr:YihY/virulence factor BrkB family protein [Bacillus sp. FJAT-42376]AZB41672.1 YihY/virulence factor BrkB family protein [Bacillus sp. FJAT-42376]
MSRRKNPNILIELLRRFSRDEVAGLSAELAYFFLLSLFPFMIALITLIAFIPLSVEDLLKFIRQYAPADSIMVMESALYQLMNQESGLLFTFGILAAIWSASNGIDSIMRAFNRAYDVRENRSFLKSRAIAILLAIVMMAVIVIALLFPVFGQEIGLFVFSAFGIPELFFTVWNIIRWVASAIIIFFIFILLHKLAPNKRMMWSQAFPGALLSTVGWIVVSYLFSNYVSNFGNYSATYGSIGGIIVFMIWFYLTGMIIIMSGELNAILVKRDEDTEKP